MSELTCKASPTDVIGPLPDESAIIVMSGGGKIFPLRCSLGDAAICKSLMENPAADSPYSFVASSLARMCHAHLTWAELMDVDGQMYAKMFFESDEWPGPSRRPTHNPAEAVNMSLASGRTFVEVAKDTMSRVVDSRDALLTLKRRFGKTWFLGQISNTQDLQFIDEYLDAAMPNGSVFADEKA